MNALRPASTLSFDPRKIAMNLLRRAPFALVCAALLSTTGCDDGVAGPDLSARELGVVVTSVDLGLSIFDVDDATRSETIGLGPDGSPVTLAVRGRWAAVPMGIVPAVAVVDLQAGAWIGSVGLPEGSGATGAAFVNDSIVLVANPGLGTVSPVNVRAGTAGPEITVGRYPQAVVAVDGRAYVLNAELENWVPAGPSTITVLDGSSLQVVGTVPLSGENAAAAAVGPDGRLYVIQSGTWGASDGALSIVDLSSGAEVDFIEGFGDFPGSVAVDEDGLVYVGAFGVGTMVWDSSAEAFLRGPAGAVSPGGVPSTSGVGVDAAGRVYALSPDCQAPAAVHRLDSGYASDAVIPVGICPMAIQFTEVEPGR
jgi:hypothetical protein